MQTVTTCQICGRAIKANTGVIALHGYKRPGDGRITRSCEGAQHVPYEVGCDAIAEVIRFYKSRVSNYEMALDELTTNPPETLTYYEGYRKELRTLTKPSNFDPDKSNSYIPGTYANQYDTKKRHLVKSIKEYKHEIEYLEQRLRDWKPTTN